MVMYSFLMQWWEISKCLFLGIICDYRKMQLANNCCSEWYCSVTDKWRIKIISIHVLLLLVAGCLLLVSCEAILAQIALLIHFWVKLAAIHYFWCKLLPSFSTTIAINSWWFAQPRSMQNGGSKCKQVNVLWCPWPLVSFFWVFSKCPAKCASSVLNSLSVVLQHDGNGWSSCCIPWYMCFINLWKSFHSKRLRELY